jgi:hypothetical protein
VPADPVQVSKYRPDHHGIFDAGDDFDITTALAAGFNINAEYTL